MTRQTALRRTKWLMVSTATVALLALVGAINLSHSGWTGYATVWWCIGAINTYLYWTNLRFYRELGGE